MNSAIRNIQLVAVIIVLVATIIAFLLEIVKMYETQNVTLADLLLMFIYIEVIGLVRSSSLACGLVFELPIIMYFLTKVGLVTPEILIKYRKYALIMVLILAAVITPPDVASQVIVAIPILILYQISIYISRIVIKKDLNKN